MMLQNTAVRRIPYGWAAPRMIGLLALGFGLFTTAVGAYLGWNTIEAKQALDRAEAQARIQVAGVSTALRQIEAALKSPRVADVARSAQAGSATRDDLLGELREAGIRNVLYLVNATAPLETTTLDDLPGGGFAALDMLLEAGETGSAPAQAHFAGTPDEYLAIAARIDDGRDPLSVLWVAVPITMITNVLERPEGVDGLALRQRGSGAPVELQSIGPVPATSQIVEIPGSRFELAWHHSQVLGPMSNQQLGGLFGAGVLMLVLSGLMLRRTGTQGDDPTATDRGTAPAKPSDRDATRPSPTRSERPAPTEDAGEDDLAPLMAELSEPDADERARKDRPVDEAPVEDDAFDDGPEGSERLAEAKPDDERGPLLGEDDEDGDEDATGDLTADGEPRRAAAPARALDAPELGSFADSDEASAGRSDDEPDAAVEDVDEQAEMGEMLRALIDDGGEGASESEAASPASKKKRSRKTAAKGEAEPNKAAGTTSDTVVPDASIFRAYDIRGVVGTTLDEATAEAIGRAIGSEARERDLSRIAVARDGRLSGAKMLAALSKGLVACGLEVVDVGAVPTPVLYFAAQEIGGGSGVMVTGSHNPPDYNGFKIVLGGETLSGDSIRALHTRLVEGRLVEGEGQLGEQRITQRYIDRISNEIQLEKSLKVVADCGNGIAGAVAPRLLESIGADVIPLYAEVDGSFPNHHPDPGDPKTLEDLRLCVRNFEADVGIAFDGDGDRLGVVGPNGEIIYPDRVMMLFARDVLSRQAGAEIIYDVKCSGLLADEIEAAGGKPVMARTGHSYIKAELKQRKAPLAGEMSGHFFFGERWYGFDDGLYSAARLLEILAADTRATGQIFGGLPKAESTPELKVEMKEGEAHAFVEAFAKSARFENATIHSIDGVRADFEDGFGLVRASNTTPVLVLRFEGTSKDALSRIQGQFRDAMLALNPALKLPF